MMNPHLLWYGKDEPLEVKAGERVQKNTLRANAQLKEEAKG